MSIKLPLTIANRNFNVMCNADEKVKLLEAAQMVEDRMHVIKKNSKTVGTDKVAIMAALNIAVDLMSSKYQADEIIKSTDHSTSNLIKRINATIEELS